MNLLRVVGLPFLLLASFHAAAIEEGDISFPTSASLPPDTMQALRAWPESGKYALRSDINPYFIQGDFNGDDRIDTAVLVTEKSTGKKGIAVVHGPGAIYLLGAGHDVDDRGDDYSWLDAWYTFPRGGVEQGMGEDAAPPVLSGDALMVMKTESASALIYWSGTGYRWYQQGD